MRFGVVRELSVAGVHTDLWTGVEQGVSDRKASGVRTVSVKSAVHCTDQIWSYEAELGQMCPQEILRVVRSRVGVVPRGFKSEELAISRVFCSKMQESLRREARDERMSGRRWTGQGRGRGIWQCLELATTTYDGLLWRC